MATTAPTHPLPLPVREALGRIDRRLRGGVGLRGFGTIAVVAAGGAAAGMAADLFWPLPGWVRFALWGAWVVAVAGLAGLLARRLARPASPVALAALAERAGPELGECLTGVVGLLDGREHGAPGLIAASARDAAARAGAIDPVRVVPLKSARRWAGAGLAALAAVAAPALLAPDPFAVLARRFFSPWAGVERAGRFAVSVAPGDTVVGLDTDLTVTATVAPRFGSASLPESAWLEWADDARGPALRMAMGAVGAPDDPARTRRFRATVPGLKGPLTYRVVAGDAGEGASRFFSVRAVEPPSVASVAANIVSPEYMKFPPVEVKDAARFEAWEGGRVTLAVAADRPVRSVSVEWPAAGGEPLSADAAVSADGRSAVVTLPAEVSGDVRVTLRDTDGIAGRPEPPRRLSVRADAPPAVSLQGQEGVDRTRPDDTLRVGVSATDDVAIASAELHYKVVRAAAAASPGNAGTEAEEGSGPIKLTGAGTPSATGPGVLALASLALKPGDVLDYRVKVTDNRPPPGGPNVTWSGPVRLSVAADAPPMATRRGQAEREAIQAKLDDLKRSAAENRHEAEMLRYAADAVARGNAAWDRDRARALAAGEAAARDVSDRLRVLSRDLEESPAFRPLARPAAQAADLEAEAARASLEAANGADDPARRLAELRQADARLGAVSARLDDLQRGLDALARREADRQKLQDLADRQARLAEARGEPADQLEAGQKAVRQELDALLRDNPEMKAAMLDAQADTAEALARRARELADRQRAEAREATDLSTKNGQLRALAAEQRQLEEDARRLALDVDLPLAENARPKLNAEPLRLAVDPVARGDLAGARNRMNAAEDELRRLARDLEDLPGDLKALARRLTARQDRLNRDLDEAMGESRSLTILPDAARDAMAVTLKPLADRQRAIAELAAAVLESPDAKADRPQPKFPRQAAEAAAEAAGRAAKAVANAGSPREAGRLAVEARNALSRLANELPDPWRRREPSRRAFAEARQAFNQAAGQADRILNETARLAAADPGRAAAELAGRIGPVAEAAAKAADRLRDAAPDSDGRVEPQRRRAEGRARALAGAVRDAADPKAEGFDPAEAREALAAAVRDARAGFDRLEQKVNGQTPADDQAEELAAEQAALLKPDPTAEPAPDALRGLATALRLLPAPDAPAEQAEAARLADEAASAPENRGAARLAADATDALARKLNDREENPEPPPAADPPPRDAELATGPGQAERARELARRERRLRDRLLSLLGDRVGPQRDLRRQSSEIGRELAELRDQARPLSPRAVSPATAAAELLGKQAPGAMDDAADRLTMGLPDPARDAQRRAAELAERGAQQADDLVKALRADRPSDDDLNADAKHRNPGENALADAREAVDKAAKRLADARNGDPHAEPPRPGEGQGQGEREGKGPPNDALAEARRAMKGAAEKLQDAADQQSAGRGRGQGQGKGDEPGGPASATATAAEPRGRGAGVAAAESLGDIRQMIRSKTGRSWGELPGHLRTEILQMSQGRYRDDYARLIQLYFREIAGAGDEGDRP